MADRATGNPGCRRRADRRTPNLSRIRPNHQSIPVRGVEIERDLRQSERGWEGCAETEPLRRGWREGELRTLPVIRLWWKDQQGSTHIPAGVPPRQAMRFRAKLTGS